MLTVRELEEAESLLTLVFPLVVPTHQEVINSKDLDLSKSPINVCYTKPAIDEKSGEHRSWFEIDITFDYRDDLPPKEKWFYIITDDGYGFKARFSGKKVKRLSSFEDTEILGRWIKGSLVDSGSVWRFDYVSEDRFREGIITKEVLESYGGDKLIFKKTNKTKKDGRGVERDVWLLSFPCTIDFSYLKNKPSET